MRLEHKLWDEKCTLAYYFDKRGNWFKDKRNTRKVQQHYRKTKMSFKQQKDHIAAEQSLTLILKPNRSNTNTKEIKDRWGKVQLPSRFASPSAEKFSSLKSFSLGGIWYIYIYVSQSSQKKACFIF